MTANPEPDSNQEDPYRLHRLALMPLRQQGWDSRAAEAFEAVDPDRFSSFLESNGLEQIWRNFLNQGGVESSLASWQAALTDHARLTAAHQMIQNRAIAEWSEALDGQGFGWFVFKGADLRNWLYSDPVLRPVSDIDIFIRETDVQNVIGWAKQAGYELLIDPATASHEVTLVKGRVSIDLHWHLLRPGRARTGLNDWLFDHREKRKDFCGLDATASLLVMLVHPAITKYLISPTSMLIHLVDQARLIQGEEVDWQALSQALDRYGVRTAAWSSLYLLRRFTAIEAPAGFAERIQPSAMKRAWLRQWIDRAWISRWFDHRWLVAGLFSLALQDGVRDVFRAAWLGKKQARRNTLVARL